MLWVAILVKEQIIPSEWYKEPIIISTTAAKASRKLSKFQSNNLDIYLKRKGGDLLFSVKVSEITLGGSHLLLETLEKQYKLSFKFFWV